ncbi:hypothetical protein MFIFM68171_08028 [Madurella fahalii]|uniref:Zn(2)-C6 fungal-type domain-containing protein n=1 Tax=Madurella fahalii TaxID=1157608 RepID=A0ABQ0GJ83_9PEZI
MPDRPHSHQSPLVAADRDAQVVNARTRPKSKTGCLPCKRRKLKCDEQHPRCKRCEKSALPCEYPPGRLVDSKPPTPSSDSSHLLDLELMHYYSTVVYADFTCNASLHPIWQHLVVRLALRSDYLLKTLLAVSALHRARRADPESRESYLSTAYSYHQTALQSAMSLMSNSTTLHDDEAVNLFLFSSLTIYFVLGSPLPSPGDGSNSLLLFGTPFVPNWVSLFRGTKALIPLLADAGAFSWPSPSNSKNSDNGSNDDISINQMLQVYAERWSAIRPATLAPSPEQTALDNLQRLLESTVGPDRPDELRVYLAAVSELRVQFDLSRTAVEHKSMEVSDVFIWVYTVIDDFVPLLRVPTQEALAVFAHFCALLKRLEFHWWLAGWADHLMGEIQRLVDYEHKSWIEWPVAEVARGNAVQSSSSHG